MKNKNYLKSIKQYFVLLLIMGYGQMLFAQTQCNPDIIPPVAICDVNVSIALDENGKATVNAKYFDDGSYDNCAQVLQYSVTSDIRDSVIEFSSLVSKDTFISLFITDEADNQNSCFVKVSLISCKSSALICNDEIHISIMKGTSLTLTSDLILEGGPYCPNKIYELWLIDENGDRIPAEIDENTITPITLYIKDLDTDITCWGTIKEIKVIDCGIQTLACRDTVEVILPKGDSLALKADIFLEGGPYCQNNHYDVNLVNINGVKLKNPSIT